MIEKLMKGLRYLVLAVVYLLILFYAVAFNNSTGWSLWFFMTFFLLFSFLSFLPSIKKIQIQLKQNVLTHVNEKNLLSLVIAKPKPTLLPIAKLTIGFPKWLSQEKSTYYCFTGHPKELTVAWLPTKRGLYDHIPIHYQGSDFFELFFKTHTCQLAQQLTVLPEDQQHIQPLLTIFETKYRQSFGETNFTVKNHRQYQFGDPLKNIDWKLSSRHQTLIYREYEREQNPEILLIFWGCSSPQFEETLSVYYSLQKQLLTKLPVKQLLFGKHTDINYSGDVKNFAAIQPFEQTPVLPLINQQHIFIFAPEIDEQLKQQIELIKNTNQITLYDYTELAALLSSEPNSDQKEGVHHA